MRNMSSGWSRGRLEAAPPPEAGERFELVARFGDVEIEQIVSSASPDDVLYDQPEDEWVVVRTGHATLWVDGATVELTADDWLFLPARVPHRVVATAPGTTWLAVRRHPSD